MEEQRTQTNPIQQAIPQTNADSRLRAGLSDESQQTYAGQTPSANNPVPSHDQIVTTNQVSLPSVQTNFSLNQSANPDPSPQPSSSNSHQLMPNPPSIQPLLSPENNSVLDANLEAAKIPSSPNNILTQEQPQQVSPHKAVVTKVRLTDELNIFDWFRTKDIINQLAEKARSSVDSVITVLDPGMKEYLYSGGNINIIVICNTGSSVSSIRDAFQTVFGRATVTAAKFNPPETFHDHPVRLANGFEAAIQVAQDRIKKLRLDTSGIPQNQVVIAVQPSLVNLRNQERLPNQTTNGHTPDNSTSQTDWFLTYCMIIEDPILNTTLSAFSQLIPIEADIVKGASDEKIQDVEASKLGFNATIDSLMNRKLGITEEDSGDQDVCRWLLAWAGLDGSKMTHDLGVSLAHMYRRKWNECIG